MKMPIPDDWDGTSYCSFAVCWPDSLAWRALLRGFITLTARGRTWDERTGVITDIQQVGRNIDKLNRPLRRSIMSCEDGNQFLVGLQAVADAIRYGAEKSCACSDGGTGSGGSGGQSQPANPTDIINQTGPIPGDFDTWSEYLDYKCAQATRIVDDAIADVSIMGTLALLGATAGEIALALAPLLLTPVPFDEIIALAGILVLVVTSAEAILTDALAAIQAMREDLICQLYVSSNSQNAQDRWVNLVVDYVAVNYPTQPENLLITTLLVALGSIDSMNSLANPDPINPPGAGDCSECATPCIVNWTFNQAILDFTFEDLSDSGNSAVYALASPNGVQQTNVVTNQQSKSAIGRYTIDAADMTINPGDQIQIDIEPVSGIVVAIAANVVLEDLSTETKSTALVGPATATFTFTTLTGTIDEIWLQLSNSTGATAQGYTNVVIMREARLYLGDTVICISGN